MDEREPFEIVATVALAAIVQTLELQAGLAKALRTVVDSTLVARRKRDDIALDDALRRLDLVVGIIERANVPPLEGK